MIKVEKAELADLDAILQLQKIAFLIEAERVGSFEIEPLQQSLDELRDEFNWGVVLKVCDGADITGSVRGYMQGDTAFIGKLMVHPRKQRQGIGSALLSAIENRFPEAQRYELFTSSISEDNLRLYAKNGYKEFKCKNTGLGFELVFMEKFK